MLLSASRTKLDLTAAPAQIPWIPTLKLGWTETTGYSIVTSVLILLPGPRRHSKELATVVGVVTHTAPSMPSFISDT
jgi:hypothetical protein